MPGEGGPSEPREEKEEESGLPEEQRPGNPERGLRGSRPCRGCGEGAAERGCDHCAMPLCEQCYAFVGGLCMRYRFPPPQERGLGTAPGGSRSGRDLPLERFPRDPRPLICPECRGRADQGHLESCSRFWVEGSGRPVRVDFGAGNLPGRLRGAPMDEQNAYFLSKRDRAGLRTQPGEERGRAPPLWGPDDEALPGAILDVVLPPATEATENESSEQATALPERETEIMEGSWKELRLGEAGRPGDRPVKAGSVEEAPKVGGSTEDLREPSPSAGEGPGSGLFELPEATTTGRRCIHCGTDVLIDRVFRCTWCRMGPQCRTCNGLHETNQGFVVPFEKRPMDERRLLEGSPGRGSDQVKDEIEDTSTLNPFSVVSFFDTADMLGSAKTGEYLVLG